MRIRIPSRLGLSIAASAVVSCLPVGAAPFLDAFDANSAANYIESNVLFGGGTSGNPQYSIDSGNSNVLQHTIGGFSGSSAVQSVYLHQTAGLSVGETVILDLVGTNAGGNEQIGVVVSLTGDPPDASPNPPSTDSRRTDFFTAGFRPGNGSADFVSERFDGTSNLGQSTGDLDPGTLAGLYISRISATGFVSGWVDSSDVLHEVGSYTGSSFTASDAFIGIYSDIRSGGFSSTVDNLRVVETAAPFQIVLFADSFDAPNGPYDSASPAGRLSGVLVGEAQLRSFGTGQNLVSNRLALVYPGGTPGGGLRFERADNDPVSGPTDRYDWAGGSAAGSILASGGISIRYDWTPSNAGSTEWHAWSFGTENSDSSDSSRVNNPGTDYGILIRQNGGTQRFDSGSSLGSDGSAATSSGTSVPVSIDLLFDSFADGATVTAVTTIDGSPIASDSFQWAGNAGQLRFEIGCNVNGHLIDNLTVSTYSPPTASYSFGLDSTAFGGADPVGTTIGTLSGTLGGLPQPSSFALVAGAGDDDNGLFQVDGNLLGVGSDFSGPGHADGQAFSVRIQGTSTGGGGETAERIFVLTLHKEENPGGPPVFPPGAAPPAAPTSLRVDDTVEPVGTSATPCFGWHVNDPDSNEIQTAYQILVASSAASLAANTGDLWDSGQMDERTQNHVAYSGSPLQGDMKVFWKVRTWDKDGNVGPYSGAATFVVGPLQNSDWSGAHWIKRNTTDSDDYTYYRKQVALPDKPVERATVYISSAHKYALYFNDTLVGKGPAYHYPEYQYYNAYDITPLVQTGAPNQFAVFSHWFGGGQGRPASARGVILKAVIHYADATTTEIGTDGTWKQTRATAWVPGQPHRNAGEGVGYVEEIDAAQLIPDWSTAAFDDSAWGASTVIGSHPVSPWTGILAPDLTRIVETEILPASITDLGGGKWVVDLGKVYAGVPRIQFQGGTPGTTVNMRGGYVLNVSGEIDTSKNQSTNMEFRAVLDGGSFTLEPVEYLGMRYFQIDNAPMAVTTSNFSFIERHSEMDAASSSFDSPDAMLNAVWDLMKHSLFTCAQEEFVDTPTREKGGFLGDAAIQSTVAMPVTNERRLTRRVLKEFLQSMDQHWSGPGKDGRMNAVYPNGDGARDIPDFTQAYLPWVWNYYLETGDLDFLSENYALLKSTADYVDNHTNGSTGLVTNLTGGSGAYLYGIVDWPATMRFGYDMTAARTVINGWALADYGVMARIAGELGKTADRNLFWSRADALEAAMNSQLINGSGVYVDGLGSGHVSQHANMFPLALGAVPPAHEATVVAKVKELEMSVGMVTLPWLIRAIGESEEGEHLLELFTNDTWNGWARCLSLGATATWESWDADTTGQSLSHGWGASGLEGYLRYVLGVKPLKAQYGQMQIKPLDFGAALDWAEGTVPTDRGSISVRWERVADAYRLDVTLPTNVVSTILVPKGGTANPTVFVDGFEVTATIEGDSIEIPPVGSGEHTIVRVDDTLAPMDAWRVHFFGLNWLVNPDAADDADPDADGLTNDVEYGLGFDPLKSSVHLLPKPERQGQDVTIAYPAPRPEIDYSIRGTEDLALDANDWDILPTTVEMSDGVKMLRATVSLLDHPRYFIRLAMSEMQMAPGG